MATLDGIKLRRWLIVEIYSRSQEKWVRGVITKISYYDWYDEDVYEVEYDDGGSKGIPASDIDELMRIPKDKEYRNKLREPEIPKVGGIPLKEGLEVEIYSKSREKWIRGHISSIGPGYVGLRYNDEFSKAIAAKDVHLFLRLPPKKQSDGQDEEKKLQDFSQQISDKLPLKKETVYESLSTLLKDARNIDIHEKVTWRGVLEAVDQELYPKIATAMTMSVEELAEEGILGMAEFEPHVIDAVIRLLKIHKNDVLNKELDFIRDLIARTIRRNETPKITTAVAKKCSFFRYKEFNDISDFDADADLIPNLKWKGLTANLVVDIYGILKAMKYGASQRENYSKIDFLRDIESAESKILKDESVSNLVEEIDIESAVSFHPQYVIKDDLFETVNPLLAMSLVLNKLESEQIGNGLKVKCVVVPALITSIYDQTKQFESNIDSVAEYLRLNLPRDTRIVNDIVSATSEVPETAKILKEMMDYVLSRFSQSLGTAAISPPTICLIFDRKAHGASSSTLSVHVFAVSDRSALVLSELDRNYFLGMELIVSPSKSTSSTRRASCWLRFGMAQRIRFVPEQLVWIVPSVFGRSSTMKPYDFWSRVYGDDYKHRWSISLNDDILSKFHHILTGNILCSVNYHRDEVAALDVGFDGLRDHLEQTLDSALMEKVQTVIAVQCYDSDAVVEDVMVMEKQRTRFHGTSNDSNLCRHLNGPKCNEWHQLKHGVMSYLKIECDFHDKRDVADCPLIENVIQNLIRFEQHGLEIDASNIYEFSLSPLVKGLGHLYRVHEYALPENKHPIRRYVIEHVQCHLGTKCPAVQQHGDRKRENERRRADRQKEPNPQNDNVMDEVETLCEALRDNLSAAHCYLLHQNDELYRLRLAAAELRFATEVVGDGLDQKKDEIKQQDDSKEDEEIEEDPLSINYGESVLEWLSFGDSPKFESLRKELVYNEDSTLDQDLLDRMIVQCAAAIEGTNYMLKEALALKAYADATAFQSELRKAHWKGLSMEVKTSYFHWAMTLYESHLYHAKIVPAISGKPRGIYHGLNRMFMMHNELPIYLGPFSVSTNKTVAKQFSNEKGLLFTIAPSYVNPFKFSVGIEMVTFSSFKNEAEILFNNQPIPIKKTETFSEAMTRLVNHFLFSVKNRKTRINDVAAFWNKVGLEWNDQWIPFILKHKLLFEKTRFEGRKTIDRLFAELQIMNQRLVEPILDRKHDDGRPYLVYLLEDLKAKPLLQHYRVLTSNFNILAYSKNINRSWAAWRRNNNMNHVLGVGNVDDSCFDDAEYQINRKTTHRGGPGTGTVFIVGPLSEVTVQSARFFGGRVLPVHGQGLEKARRIDGRVRHDFGDLLRVDGYSNGCVFIDDIPTPNYQFQIDHEVKCSDDLSGKISRVLEGKVCVKIEQDSMCHFRWFESEQFPMELTLNLESQKSIRYAEDYSDESTPMDFAVVEGERDQSLNLNPKQLHQFHDIDAFEISCKEILEKKQESSFIGVYVRVDNHGLGWSTNAKQFWNCLKVIKYPAEMVSDRLLNSDEMTSVIDCVDNMLQNLKNCHFEITDEASYLELFRLDQKRFSEWMAHVTSHSLLFADTAYRRRLIIERLIVELKLWSTDWIHRILEQKMKDKPMIQWLVEDRKVSQLHEHYRIYMSHFTVRRFQHLAFQWFEFEKNSNMKEKAGFDDFGDMCFDETDYYFDGKVVPFNTQHFKGNVSKISVKNTKLFGDQLVVIQDLDANSDSNSVGHNISECLKIDQYNKSSIFIDEVPPKDYQFRIGQSIRCNDQRKGVIAQLTANEICIKLGEANLYSFRWISRVEAPKEVTLIFENQSSFAEFEFKTDIDPSSSTTYNFSSIDGHDKFSILCREIAENQSVWRTIRISAKPRNGNYEWTQIREIDYSSNTEAALSISEAADRGSPPIERLMAVLQEGDFEIREGERVLRELDLPNQREKDWLPLITNHPLLFAVTSYRRRLIIERLIVELKLWNTDWIHRILEGNKSDKPLIRWLVEDREVVRLYDHYRVYMSFQVQSSSLLHRRWLKYEKKTIMSGKTGFDDSDETCFQMTTYEADGEPILPTTASVTGNVRHITARNEALFGGEHVVLHEFRESQEQKHLSDDFVNALKVDQYSNGCVFVDDIPSTNIGHTVQLDDGAKGRISRVTSDEICIKIKSDNADDSRMNSYRWIPRSKATLIFRGQSDLLNYRFAVTLGHSDESIQFSDAESQHFADVKDFMIPCPGLSGYQSGTVIIGVYAKPRDGDYQWAPVTSIEYPSHIELVQVLRAQTEIYSSLPAVERLIMVLLQSEFELRDSANTMLSLDSDWVSIIEHPHIFEVTAYRRKLVIERLMVELKLWRMEWIHRILEQKMNNKPMIQWLVEDRRVSQLYDHYRVFMSRFSVKFSPLLNRRWLRLEMTTKMRGERGFGRPGDACFQLTTYQADGETIPFNIPTIKGTVRQITAKNFKLFGDRPVVLHEFRDTSEQKQISSDFVGALKVDQYSNGCVFVDDIPLKTELFDVGRGVRSDDGAKGRISQATDNRICIKMKGKDENMVSVRWISRASALKELKTTFQGEGELNGYIFAARIEHRDESIKASRVKFHTFTEVKDFVIPCGGIASYFAGFAVICIYARPQDEFGDFNWARIKTLKYASKSLMIAPSVSNSEEAKVDRLMKALIENDHELGDWEEARRTLGLESPEEDSESDSESDSEPKWMALISNHPLLCSVTSYRRKLVLERFIVELELMSTELIHRILELKMENKPMLQWLMEDRKVNKLYDHYRVFMSRFTESYSALLNYRWLRFQKKMKRFGGGFNWLKSVCFERTDYLADGHLIPNDRFGIPHIPAVKGDVRQITIENFELFGYESVVLQKFEEQSGDHYISDDFADALRCDAEFVFLNHIPSASYPFCVGQEVQCNDGCIGTVIRITSHKICVKFIRSDIISFRWFEREQIPLELTLTFRYKDELKDYRFAVSRRRMNTRDLSANEFSDIASFKISCKSLHLNEEDLIYVFAKPMAGDYKWVCIKTLKISSDSVPDDVSTPSLTANAFRFLSWLRQRDLKITDSARTLERFGLKKYQSSQWMPSICNTEVLFGITANRRSLLAERLILEMDLLSIEMVHRMIEHRESSKTMLEYLVEDRKVRRLYDHYRVYTSGFKVSFSADLLDKIWLEFERNTKKIDDDEWKDAGDSCFDKTQYLINGVVCPIDSAVCLASDGHQFCRNTKLFGDRDITIEIRELANSRMRPETESSLFIRALNIDDGATIAICPTMNSELGIDRNIELKTDSGWIKGTVSRETADKICVKYSDGYRISYRWIQRDEIPTKIRYFIENRQKISEYTFAASVGTGEGVPLFYDEFTFGGDTEFAIPLDKLVASSSTADTVYIYGKPKGKDFNFEVIKRIDLKQTALSVSTFAVDGKCDIDRQYTDQSIMGSRFKVFATSDIVVSKTGALNVYCHESNAANQANAESEQKYCNSVIPKYGKFVGGDQKSGENEGFIMLISGGNIVNDGTLQCTPSNGGTIYINTDGVFENNGLIDCGEKGSIQIKCAVYKNNGQITPKPEVIYKDKKMNRRAIERLISLRDGKDVKLKVVRHRAHDGSFHPNGLLQKGTELEYSSGTQGVPAKDWVVFRTDSNQPVFPKNIVFRNYNGSQGLKTVRIEGSTDGRKFVKWIQIDNISNDNIDLQTFIVDPVSGCFAWDKTFVYFKLNIVENHDGLENRFYEFRMN